MFVAIKVVERKAVEFADRSGGGGNWYSALNAVANRSATGKLLSYWVVLLVLLT